MIDTGQKAPRINSTNILSGIDGDGRYAVRGGSKGRTYRVLPVDPPDPGEIKKMRKKANLSQREFADAIGVSASVVSSWEKGSKTPDGLACRCLDMMGRDDGLLGRYIETEM